MVTDATGTDAQRALLASAEKFKLNVFRVLANHPDLLRDWEPFSAHVFFNTSLSHRDRELLTLRSGWLCKSSYQWARHVKYAQHVGFTMPEIERVKDGPDALGWTHHEQAVLRSVDEVREMMSISEETWNTLAETYTSTQLIDLVFCIGQNFMIAAAANTFRIPLDPDVEKYGLE